MIIVKELIKALEKYPENAPVNIGALGDFFEINFVFQLEDGTILLSEEEDY